MDITLAELEDAINYWRAMRPSSGEERALSVEVNLLASLYALMIFYHSKSVPQEQIKPETLAVLLAWRAQVIKP